MSACLSRCLVIVPCASLLALVLLAVGGHEKGFAAEERPGGVGVAAAGGEERAVPPPPTLREFSAMLDQHRAQLSREIGQVKREIAALREEMAKPGLKEVFAGIGYILGLAGIALFMHARRERSLAPGSKVSHGDAQG